MKFHTTLITKICIGNYYSQFRHPFSNSYNIRPFLILRQFLFLPYTIYILMDFNVMFRLLSESICQNLVYTWWFIPFRLFNAVRTSATNVSAVCVTPLTPLTFNCWEKQFFRQLKMLSEFASRPASSSQRQFSVDNPFNFRFISREDYQLYERSTTFSCTLRWPYPAGDNSVLLNSFQCGLH